MNLPFRLGCPGLIRVTHFWQQLGSGVDDVIDACRHSNYMIVEPIIQTSTSWKPIRSQMYESNEIPFTRVFDWTNSHECFIPESHARYCCPTYTKVDLQSTGFQFDAVETSACVQLNLYKHSMFLNTTQPVRRDVTQHVRISSVLNATFTKQLRLSEGFRKNFNGVALRTERLCATDDSCDKLSLRIQYIMKFASANSTIPIFIASDLNKRGGTAGSMCSKCWTDIYARLSREYTLLEDACSLTNTTGPMCGLSEMVAISMATRKYRIATSQFHRFASGEWVSTRN